MPQQTPSEVRVIDPILTTVVQGYRLPDMIGYELFPTVPVSISGGQVLEFGKEAFKLYNSRRAPGSGTKRITFGYQGKPYALYNHALEAPVPREHLRDASIVPGIDLATRAVNLVRRNQSLEVEVEQSSLARNAALYDANHKVALSGADVWSDAASDPTQDIEDAKEAVRATIGMYPNTVAISAKAYKNAKNHPKIIDRYKHTTSRVVTPEMLAALWDVDKVVVGKSVYADDAGDFTDAWGVDVVVAYVPAIPGGQEEPSYAYTYTMIGHPMVEVPYYDNNAKSWIYGVGYERAPVLTGITAGFLIQNAGL